MSSIKPTAEADLPYICAHRRTGDYPEHTNDSGKWLVFVPTAEVDEIWECIKRAVEGGKLGSRAKVATAAPNRLASDPNRKVICVYILVWLAYAHRKKIAQKLRWLGPPTQTIYAGSIPSEESFGDATVTVGSERRALWNVEAPTPSLAKRLTDEGIELLSWYLRQA